MATKVNRASKVSTRRRASVFAIVTGLIFFTLTLTCSYGAINITIDGRDFASPRQPSPPTRSGRVDQVKTIEKAIALLTKFSPGMSYEDTVKLLDAAAASHIVGGDKDLVRKGWLHGEFGVEIYFLKERAYRIDIISQFSSETDVLRALNDVLQYGRTKYKSMPRWDSVAGEHYWVDSNMRFAYARLGRGSFEIRVSRKAIIN